MTFLHGTSVLLINQTNATSQSNVFSYKFPNGSVTFKDREIAVSSIIIPYSWYNITSQYLNTSFTLIVPTTDGVTNTTLNITIPDGFYTISQLNSFIQKQLISSNFYLVNANAQNVYYIEIVANSNLNLAQINCYVVPNALPTGYANPGWILPTNGTRVIQFVVNNSAFGSLIGFTNATYPSNQTQASTYSVSSNQMPQISPVSSLLCSCSLVNNILSSPSNILTSIPITSTFGTQIIFSPNEFIWVSVLDGTYSSFNVIFTDQSNNIIKLTDSNVTINLVLK